MPDKATKLGECTHVFKACRVYQVHALCFRDRKLQRDELSIAGTTKRIVQHEGAGRAACLSLLPHTREGAVQEHTRGEFLTVAEPRNIGNGDPLLEHVLVRL